MELLAMLICFLFSLNHGVVSNTNLTLKPLNLSAVNLADNLGRKIQVETMVIWIFIVIFYVDHLYYFETDVIKSQNLGADARFH